MKQQLRILVSTSAVSVFAFSVLAQPATKPQADHPDYSSKAMSHGRRADRLNGAAKASDLIGMTVKNYQDEKLGKVEDLAVDVESGRIVQVILSTGGFIGIGDMLTSVPPGALHHDVANKVLHLDSTKEKLKGAPKFETAKWAENSNQDNLSRVYRYYGEDSSLNFINKGEDVATGNKNSDSARNPDRAWGKDRMPGTSRTMIPESRLAHVQKASKLMGCQVQNMQDEKLGKVENLLVDMAAGRVVAVVISSGGFLGMGDELSAVPPTALRFASDRETLKLDATKEMLSSSPRFKANEWPDFAQPGYASGVYRAYKVDPYFTTNMTAEADNTARNVRDRDDRTLTPLNQGNSQADVDVTTRIRKEIIAKKTMSVNARNVKVITVGGRVTLRGPVNTAEEKRLIGEIAGNVAQMENVDNQLEVK